MQIRCIASIAASGNSRCCDGKQTFSHKERVQELEEEEEEEKMILICV
jgi:hypothetical protein